MPSGLAAVAVSASQINLTWTYTGTANAFRIERRGTVGNWYSITQIHGGARSYANSPLPACSGFFYRLVAVTPTGDSIPSNETFATTTCP